MIRFDPVQVEAARQGSRAALEALVNAAKGPVFNLAMRMLAHREDAEDATQEILIKIITHLGEVRDTDLAGAWAFRVATRHLSHTARLGLHIGHVGVPVTASAHGLYSWGHLRDDRYGGQ